jgi:Tfp pilus assembly protein PilX
MPVSARRRHAERGQALILALALLGLLSAFSVAALRLASASQPLASSVRQSAYQDALREAGGLMARQFVADKGCSSSSGTATFSANGEAITVTVAHTPPACATVTGPGAMPGDYILCSTVNASGVDYPAMVSLTALLPNGTGTTLRIDIVHVAYGKNLPC